MGMSWVSHGLVTPSFEHELGWEWAPPGLNCEWAFNVLGQPWAGRPYFGQAKSLSGHGVGRPWVAIAIGWAGHGLGWS
jgi:hypothetical protein